MSDKKTQDMKEYMRTYMRNYWIENNEKLTEKKTCEVCNCEYQKCNKAQHFRSKKHKLNEKIYNYENNFNELKKAMKLIKI